MSARFKMAAAAAKGTSHEARGEPCQDFVATLRGRRVCAIALADGASSARHAETGARATVSGTLKILAADFDNLCKADVLQARERVVERLRRGLTRHAMRHELPLSDLASTLLFCASDGTRFVCGQLGDGRIACFDRARTTARCVFAPVKGEFFNQTVFVTSDRASAALQWQTGSVTDVGGFALLSDGAEESLFNRAEQRFAPALSRMLGWLENNSAVKVKKALASNLEATLREETNDDLAIALMYISSVDQGGCAQVASL